MHRGFRKALNRWRGAPLAAFALAVLFAGSSAAFAQARPIQVFLLADMDFGAVVATAPSGTMRIDSAGGAIEYNGVLNTGGAISPATFEIHGERFQTFNIELPATAVSIPAPAGGGFMIIDNFESDPPADNPVTLNAQGKATVTVGATMHITDQLSAGAYASSFDLTFVANY
jgi:hypothetical protein